MVIIFKEYQQTAYLNNSLVGPLHGEAKAASAGVPGLNDELVVLVYNATLEAVTVSLDLVRVTTRLDSHRVG